MKKFYTLTLMLFLCAASMFAQKCDFVNFVTVDADGKKTGELKDGAVINVSNVTEDEFVGSFISAGLGIENITTSSKRVQISYKVTSLDNGYVQCCFPPSCTNGESTGTYYVPQLSKSGNHVNLSVLKKDKTQDIAAEWFFLKDGKATVTFTVWVGTRSQTKTDAEGDVFEVEEGPSVTVNFTKSATGINSSVVTPAAAKTSYFDLTGRQVSVPTQGVYVEKQVLTDGTVKTQKVSVK